MIGKIKNLARKNKFFGWILHLMFLILNLVTRLCYLCFRVFPVQKDKVVCCNMKGKRYGDNPKYVSDVLKERRKDLKIVWLMNDKNDPEIPEDVIAAKRSFFSEIYHLSTAAVWIDSNTKAYGTLKRRGQLYIQTWHGSYGLKKFGLELGDKLDRYDRIIYRYNARLIDIMLSNSRQTTEIYRKSFDYNGDFLECGSPRNDLFFQDPAPVRAKVDEHFGTAGKKLLLYAPTFRNDMETTCFDVDFTRLINALSERFGGDWVILIRLHPNNISAASKYITYSDKIMNATDYDVMQELLVASDIILSDYSSCMFDFVTKRAPCFIYATDSERYKGERDYYFELEELPFPFTRNNDELERAVLDFDGKAYDNGLERLFERVGLSESGRASEVVADRILEHLNGGHNK